jgi:hypothetical protein
MGGSTAEVSTPYSPGMGEGTAWILGGLIGVAISGVVLGTAALVGRWRRRRGR